MKTMVLGMFLALVLAGTLALTFEIELGKAGSGARVFVYPANQTVGDVGDSFTVSVGIAGVSDLYGYQLELYYNSTLMNGTDVFEGPFLRSPGGQTQFLTMDFTDNYNSTDGIVSIVGTLLGEVSGVSGGGVLVTVGFKSLAQGTSIPLFLENVELADSSSLLMSHDDSDGTVTVGSISSQSSPPIASFDWSPPLGIISGEPVSFNGSSSFSGWNGSQALPIVSYNWDFGDNSTANGQVVTHSYSSLGIYNVTLNVTDSEGLWDISQRQIEVGRPRTLKADFTQSSETAVGEALKFDASSSIESWNGTYNTPIREYLWDFGDGNTTVTNASLISHIYASPGAYNVTLTISDANGDHSSCSKIVLLSVGRVPEYAFSVESNSTISDLVFDATNRTLRFTVSGPSGTGGYARITVAKSLVSDPSEITAYVDNNLVECSPISQDDSFLLVLNYTQSAHHVLLELGTISIPEFAPFMILPVFTLLVALFWATSKRRLLATHHTATK